VTSPLLGLAIAAVRCWTRIYTWRMSPLWAETRRAEIESDLWELQQDPDAGRRLAPAMQMLARLSLGVVDDLWWRAEHATLEETRLGRRSVALTAAAALALVAVWIVPAWIGNGVSSERARVLDCASDLAPAQTRAELRMNVINCAGGFFTPGRDPNAGRTNGVR